MQVVPDGHRCECGNRGCWEQYASGNALVRDARELVVANSPVAQDLKARTEGDVTRLTGPLVTEAAQAGDPLAVELLADIGTWLGVGLAGMTAAFDLGAIIVGGGVPAAGELLLGPTRRRLLADAGRSGVPHRARDHRRGPRAGVRVSSGPRTWPARPPDGPGGVVAGAASARCSPGSRSRRATYPEELAHTQRCNVRGVPVSQGTQGICGPRQGKVMTTLPAVPESARE